jgi:glutathionylspermidine synthase
MLRLQDLGALTRENLDAAGWAFLYEDAPEYLGTDAVVRSDDDVEALALAANSLYSMFVDAAASVIDGGRLAELGIPERAHRLIEYTWNDDRNWHLYGRFDIAETEVGPKLIEFNADTPTCVPETAVLQWAQAQAAGYGDESQFNGLFERLVEQFGRWKSMNDDLTPTLVLAHLESAEDRANAEVIGAAAEEAGFTVHVRALPDVTFDKDDGVFVKGEGPGGDRPWVRCDFVFKLVPWEFMIDEEPDLFDLVERLVLDRKAVVANPAYTLVFQSKMLLVELSRLFPDDPHLLRASALPFDDGLPYVEKVALGREGANVAIYNADHSVLAATDGDYKHDDGSGYGGTVYQEFAHFPHDAQVRLYQAGVFWAFEACALGYRRGDLIIDDRCQFVAHVID